MSVPAELRSALPPGIDPTCVRAAVRAPGSPGSFGGETWIVDLDGALAVLTRGSIFDPLQPVALASAGPVEQRSSEVEIRPAEGPAFVVRPSFFELEAVTKLLAGVTGLAALGLPPASPASAGPSPTPAPEPTPSFTAPTFTAASERLDWDTDADDEVEAQVAEAVARGADGEALALARAQLSGAQGEVAQGWRELVAVLVRLEAGNLVDALIWAQASDELPFDVRDPLYLRLAVALEQADEPLLAWTALDERLDQDDGAELRERLEPRLSGDGDTRARALAVRARDRLLVPAQDGDPFAQRALAQALRRLDDIDQALTWVRRAKLSAPSDEAIRELELDILLRTATERRDDTELLAAVERHIADFPRSTAPWVTLGRRFYFVDPPRAIEALREAQARAFSSLVLLDLTALLASQGRHEELVRVIEDAFGGAHADDIAEFAVDDLRAKLAASRAALARSAAPGSHVVAPAPKLVVAVVVIATLAGLAWAILG